MTLLEELVTLITQLEIPVETGIFNGKAPDRYVVLSPLSDRFALNADDCPSFDVQEVRISLFSRNNPRQARNSIIRALQNARITITNRVYIEYEPDTLLHHYELDTAQLYPWNDESEG
jgi:hypothetical protein